MRLFSLFLAVVFIASCAPTRYPPGHHSSSSSADGVNTLHLGEGGKVKRGNPYQIDGVWYYPLSSGESYDETGVASWYGEKFHGLKTANGETYNMYAMTAAHTTLPMPSIVQVTNLENGKSIRVRVNDRGPFVKSRLIDLSYAAAKALGVIKHGTAKVRVQTIQSADVSAEKAWVSSVNKDAVAQPFVQVGAFSSQENAAKVLQSLQGKATHASAQVMPAGKIFRVRLGPFAALEDAAVVLQSVKDSGYPEAMIIHD